jgi:acetyl esterase/lipase
LDGLAPILIQVGELEIFVDECKEMHARAEQQGLGDDHLRLEVYPAMTHVFMLHGYLPEAQASANAVRCFVEKNATRHDVDSMPIAGGKSVGGAS